MKKKMLLTVSSILLVCILITGVISMIQVICISDSEVWALPPRKTIDNVLLALTEPGDRFQFLGTYTDIKGTQWYIVSGVLDIYTPAGQNIGFVEKENTKLVFG